MIFKVHNKIIKLVSISLKQALLMQFIKKKADQLHMDLGYQNMGAQKSTKTRWVKGTCSSNTFFYTGAIVGRCVQSQTTIM